MDPDPRTVDPAYAFIGAFVEELARGGLAHVCICPGSRSTPLALSFAYESRIRLWMHLDERSAAFFALGLAKATRTPVALVCTSGTAVANFMPAVVEARQARVPLIVLTADRPPELRDAGAPQTIDQIRFYGSQAKWAVEMPLPEATDVLLRFARTAAARALSEAGEVPAGPVHLNFPLREPLVPTPSALPSVSESARQGRGDGQPYATITPGVPLPSAPHLQVLAERLASEAHGLIVAGPMDEPGLAAPLAALARVTGYPILADPLSGLRCGPHDRSLIVDAYDAFLRDARFAAAIPARMVLRFGAMPTAKPLLQYLQRHPEAETIVVDPAGWREPTLLAAEMVRADPLALCTALLAHFGDHGQPVQDGRWATRWVDANRRSRQALTAGLAAVEEPSEPRAIAELATLLPGGATLFAGNSMPVRDIDTFFAGTERPIRIIGNRGASGIDGVVSTALGVAAAGGGPVVLVIGDVSLYHDMNGLLAARQHGLDLTIVLLNNDGCGIFSFLPQADMRNANEALSGDSFELLWGTPHGLDFRHAAALYGATYTHADTWPVYRQAVARGIANGGLHIVEVPTDRERNVTLHRQLWPAVSAAIADPR